MPNAESTLAEESKKIQKLREKLKQQLDLVEQRVLERTLKNKSIKLGGLEKKESVGVAKPFIPR